MARVKPPKSNATVENGVVMVGHPNFTWAEIQVCSSGSYQPIPVKEVNGRLVVEPDNGAAYYFNVKNRRRQPIIAQAYVRGLTVTDDPPEIAPGKAWSVNGWTFGEKKTQRWFRAGCVPDELVPFVLQRQSRMEADNCIRVSLRRGRQRVQVEIFFTNRVSEVRASPGLVGSFTG